MDSEIVFILEIIGTVAFSVSGAMIGIQKKMDIFGVAILGLTTAVGGGILRDLMIGNIPPQTFRNPVYALTAILTAIGVFIAVAIVKKARHKEHIDVTDHFKGKRIYDLVMLIMDTLGLAIFTVVGIQTAENAEAQFGWLLLIFVGVVTGVGGGVIRDIMAGNTPYIFVKHIYACASLAGAAVYLVCAAYIHVGGKSFATILAMGVIMAIRFLAARFKWNLPRIN